MNPLKSVGARLSLALAVVVAGALGAVYLAVVPSLQRNLTHAKLRDLERVAPALRRAYVNDPLGVYDPDFAGIAAERANARAAVVDLFSESPPALQVMRDSRQGAPSTDIENDRLARAFDRMRLRLAQLDHARSEFIANASHELRTPLFSLGGFLELMGDEELDEATRREFLDTMREQVDRLTKPATDLLDLSRLDVGRL